MQLIVLPVTYLRGSGCEFIARREKFIGKITFSRHSRDYVPPYLCGRLMKIGTCKSVNQIQVQPDVKVQST